jgi:hypothetical protein
MGEGGEDQDPGIYRLRPQWRQYPDSRSIPVPFYPLDRWERYHGTLPSFDHERLFQTPRGAFGRSGPGGSLYVAVNLEKASPEPRPREERRAVMPVPADAVCRCSHTYGMESWPSPGAGLQWDRPHAEARPCVFSMELCRGGDKSRVRGDA